MTDPVATDEPTADTPEPVLKAAALWGTLSAFIVSLIGVLVAAGVLSSDQAQVLNDTVTAITTNIVPVGIAIVGIVGLVSGIVSHLVTAFVARRKVTPVPAAVRYRRAR